MKSGSRRRERITTEGENIFIKKGGEGRDSREGRGEGNIMAVRDEALLSHISVPALLRSTN